MPLCLAGRWIKFPKDRGFAKQIVEILVSQRLNLIQRLVYEK